MPCANTSEHVFRNFFRGRYLQIRGSLGIYRYEVLRKKMELKRETESWTTNKEMKKERSALDVKEPMDFGTC